MNAKIDITLCSAATGIIGTILGLQSSELFFLFGALTFINTRLIILDDIAKRKKETL